MTGVARLADGHDRPAIVIYTAAVADAATRTFRVEAEIANPDGRIGQGMTAELRLPLPALPAHRISPSTFLLDAEGQVGVVIVDDSDTARFRRIAVLGADAGGAWVSGLPDRTRIITVGQQLVADGEPVEAVEIGAGAPQS
jgi:multidrug efflux system membrane fusion protein